MMTLTAGQKTPDGTTYRVLPSAAASYNVFIDDKQVPGELRDLNDSYVKKALEWVTTCPALREYSYTLDKRDYMWDGHLACLYNQSGPNITHEVAHWLLASEDQKKLTDFGIGIGPESTYVPDDSSHLKYKSISASQESSASVLGIAIQYAIGIPSRETMLYHSWEYVSNGISNSNEEEFRHYYSQSLPILESLGFIVNTVCPLCGAGQPCS